MRSIDALRKAVAAKDSARLDEVFMEPGLDREMVPIFNQLIVADWHEQHEELADALQVLKDPSSVPALLEAAGLTVPYLVRWQNLDAFHRRCTFALADIGTSDALAALRQLSASKDKLLASYALERIEKWS